MFEEEDINKESLLEESMEIYTRNEVWDLFHISYLEFMNLPKDICAMMIDKCENRLLKKNRELDISLKALEK